MYVTTRTETRTVTPFYVDNKVRNIISISSPGRNFGITTQCERIKIVGLANGRVSVKGLGKGGFDAMHFPGFARIVVEGERSMSLRDFLFVFGNDDNGLRLAVVTP